MDIPQIEPEKFLSRVVVDLASGCWHMRSVPGSEGYSTMTIKKRGYRAHRISYRIFNGAISRDMVIDHICKNRRCVNPDHLREVSWYKNTIENSLGSSAINKLKTKCNRGHLYTDETLKIVPFIKKGKLKHQRTCKICVKINFEKNKHKYYQNRKKKKQLQNTSLGSSE